MAKGGAGAHNWGNAADAVASGEAAIGMAQPLPGEVESPAGGNGDGTAADGGAAPAGGEPGAAPAAAGDAAAAAEPEEPEEKTLTLEEVEAARAAKRAGEHFATVAQDTSALKAQFAKMKQVQRADGLDDDDADFVGKLHKKRGACVFERLACPI